MRKRTWSKAVLYLAPSKIEGVGCFADMRIRKGEYVRTWLPEDTRFVTLANSYHGETLGALAVGNVALYKDIYAPLLMDVLTAPSPDAWDREAHGINLRKDRFTTTGDRRP